MWPWLKPWPRTIPPPASSTYYLAIDVAKLGVCVARTRGEDTEAHTGWAFAQTQNLITLIHNEWYSPKTSHMRLLVPVCNLLTILLSPQTHYES